MTEIALYNTFSKIEPITKGWSGDKKYCVTSADGTNYLLRISSMERYERKKTEFEMMKRVAALGVPMCQPVEFGLCQDGAYSLQSWIYGEDAQSALLRLSEPEQYAHGLKAGEILKKIHSISAPETLEDWEPRFNRKIDRNMTKYQECSIKIDGGDKLISYINENRHYLKGRVQCYQHGDYHLGNMMIDQGGKLCIIDFDRDDYGDPWEEFNRIVWCVALSPSFSSGMIDGYFGSVVPMDFWRLLALYIASNTLSSVPWAIPFGQAEVDTMLNQAKEVLLWYEHMQNPLPTWYRSFDK
jgi:aminoglycoside phosphotransferase (APT) family kinase protein